MHNLTTKAKTRPGIEYSEGKYLRVIDIRDLFDFIRAAYFEGGNTDDADEVEVRAQAYNYAGKVLDKFCAQSTAEAHDPTDPGHDVEVLREHVRHLERRVRELSQAQPKGTAEPDAWQERQEVRPGVFGEWYDRRIPWGLNRPQEMDSGGIRYQFRPLYAHPAPSPAPAHEDRPACNPHPKAPHGFDRNASHNAGRYVCNCEGWDAWDSGYQAGVRAGLDADESQAPAVAHEQSRSDAAAIAAKNILREDYGIGESQPPAKNKEQE